MADTTEAPARTPAADRTDSGTIARLGAQRQKFRAAARRLTAERDALKEEIGRLKGGPEAAERIAALEKELRGLKHRSAFDRLAHEAGVGPGKALDDLWSAIGYDAEGEADEPEITRRIGAAKPDRPYLFAEGGAAPEPPKGEAPRKAPGPGGTGRGAPADGAGTLKLRKSDLQSFDPAVNPLLDRDRAAEVNKARREGKLVYVDE